MNRLTLYTSPLIEAITFVDFQSPQPMDIKAIKAFAASNFGKEFVLREFKRRKVVLVKGDKKPKIEVEDVGIILTSPKKKIGLFRNRYIYAIKGMGLSWESYINDALDLFAKYKDFVSIRAILAFSVRNRNLIELPDGVGDFADIVRHTPWEHKDLGDSVCLKMNYRDSRYYTKRNVYATVEQNYSGGFGSKYRGILLDIKTTKLFSVQEKVKTITKRMLDDIRETKDLLFVSSLTASKLQTYKNEQDK